MNEELLKRLIEFLETASPYAWQVVSRQVLVVMIQSIFWCVATTISAIVCTGLAKKEYAKYIEDTYGLHELNCVFLAIGAIIAAVVAACLASNVIAYVFNPDYCAIKMLLSLVK